MKILILTCNTGQGHNATARSLSAAFERRHTECVTMDALSFISPKLSEFICSWHVRLYRYAPVLFDQGYEFAEKHPSVMSDDSVIYNFFSLGVKKLENYMEEQAFDGVICVHVFPALMITELKKTTPLFFKTAFIATDYTCSPGVAESMLDAYFIPHRGLIGEFMACGVPEDKLIVSGIPVRDTFFHSVPRSEARKALGIPENARHLLMMCGSMGCGPMENLSVAIKKIMPEDAFLTVVCGTNEKLQKKLEPLASENMQILGFTDKVSLLMDSADLYMTKPGGLSVTEAAHKHLPLVFIDAVSGCESYNRYFFLTHGMAVASNDRSRLPQICLKRLYDAEALAAQKQAMAEEFTTDPAEIICDFFIRK